MPKLPQPTAQGRSAIANLPDVSPQHFGARAFAEVEGFGQHIQKIAETIKARQDELDLTKADDAYRVRLDGITQAIAQEPDLTKHRGLFDNGIAEAQKDILKAYPNLSSAARQVLEGTFSKRAASAAIETAHLTQKMGVTQVLTDYDQLANNRVERAAMSADPVLAANALNEIDDHRDRNVSTGMMDAAAAQKDAESRQDQYWKIVAQQRPEEFLKLAEQQNQADMPMSMPLDRTHYSNIAHNEINRRNAILAHEEAKLEKLNKQAADAKYMEYVAQSAQRDDHGLRLFSTQWLLDQASYDTALGHKQDETIKYLETKLGHEREHAKSGQASDTVRYNRELLPRIWGGEFNTELQVLKAAAVYGAFGDNAVEQFHKYQAVATRRVTQDYQHGGELIRKTFALPPGASIDQAGVLETGVRALDRFNTWYSSQVERAAKEGVAIWDGVDVMAQARKIKDEEHKALQGNLITIIRQTESSLKYKSEAEIDKAVQDQEISVREGTMHLQQLKTFRAMQDMASQSVVPSPSDRRIGKD